MKGILRVFLVASLLLMLAPVLAFSQTSDTINIGGLVPLVLQLTVAPDINANNLALEGADPTFEATIATITVDTNNNAGWELWAYSANAGVSETSLVNPDASDSITYTVTYTGSGGVTDEPITDQGLMFGENAGRAGDAAEPLAINYEQLAAGTRDAGYYSDQLTIVLRAK